VTNLRDAAAIRDDLRTLGRLPVLLTDQGAPLRLAGDVAPLLDRCGFLERAARDKIAAEIEHILWNFGEPFARLPVMAAVARVARGGEATE